MSRKHIKFVSTLNMSRSQWLEERQKGIGGSEVGTILGHNPYFSSLELFYQKVGVHPIGVEDNEAMLWGRELEDKVANMWQYWDGTVPSYIENFNAGKKVRKCRRINAIVINEKYPWLRANIDRIYPGGILECKTISEWAAKQWVAEIPPIYIFQTQQYMLLMEKKKAEIATLKNGRNFYVDKFEAVDSLQQQIIESSKAFWDKVVLAREMTQYMDDENEIMNVVRELEPEPDGSQAYEDFLNEQFKKAGSDNTIYYVDEDMQWVKKYKWYHGAEKKAKNIKTEFSSRLKKKLLKNNANRIDFGDYGSVTWGKSGLRVNVKIEEAT